MIVASFFWLQWWPSPWFWRIFELENVPHDGDFHNKNDNDIGASGVSDNNDIENLKDEKDQKGNQNYKQLNWKLKHNDVELLEYR